MKFSTSLAIAVSIPSLAFCAPNKNPIPGPQLDSIAKQSHKLYFGTATNGDELNDTAYSALINDNKMFGQITPANAMKWVRLENFFFKSGFLRYS